MVTTADEMRASLDAIALLEPGFAAAIQRVGYPAPRVREPGYETLLRTIVGQQVSVASAAAVWRRLETELGEGCAPEALLARDYDVLRACGLSRQKQGYARSLAELVVSGALDLHALPADDQLSALLHEHGVIDEPVDPDELSAWLGSSVKADDAIDVMAALQAAEKPRVALRFATKHWPPPRPIDVTWLLAAHDEFATGEAAAGGEGAATGPEATEASPTEAPVPSGGVPSGGVGAGGGSAGHKTRWSHLALQTGVSKAQQAEQAELVDHLLWRVPELSARPCPACQPRSRASIGTPG